MSINLQKGQTIIEAVVALMIILLIITAISIVIVNGLYNSKFIKNQNEANKLAQQGIEFARDLQSNNLGSEAEAGSFIYYVKQNVPYYCLDTTTNSLKPDCNPTGVNTGTSYNRTLYFTQSDGNCQKPEDTPGKSVLVTVDVKWSTSKCPSNNTFCHESKLQACLPFEYSASQP